MLDKNVVDGVDCGVLGAVHMQYKLYGGEQGGDVGAEGFKNATLGWSSTYYVAFALMMTIAFALLVVVPEPRDRELEATRVSAIVHYRPGSDVLDAVVQMLYLFFVLAAAVDSTWGMVLCAEWGVRASAVPARRFESFLHLLAPARSEPQNPRKT